MSRHAHQAAFFSALLSLFLILILFSGLSLSSDLLLHCIHAAAALVLNDLLCTENEFIHLKQMACCLSSKLLRRTEQIRG